MSVQQTSPGDSRSDEAMGELLPTQNTIGFDQGTSYTHGTINVDTQAIVSKKISNVTSSNVAVRE